MGNENIVNKQDQKTDKEELKEKLDKEPEKEKLTLMVFSGDLDKMLGAFILANGAAAMDIEVSMFFAFWGLNVLRKEKSNAYGKDLLSKMFGWMMPKGARKLKLSKMNMMGLGTSMMKHVMKKKNVMDLSTLIKSARDMNVKLIACEMSMNVMGLKKEELLDGICYAGVATALSEASESKTTLFVS